MKFNRNLLSVALAAAIATVVGGTNAQAAEPTTSDANDQQAKDKAAAEAKRAEARKDEDVQKLEQIDVVGIRRGIESAIEVKQDNTSIVEVVSAEDIGKLPDISIADSIARLPGLAAQRVAGRPSTISIRGLAGDYGTTLLNGREQVSVGDNRTVEYDQFPSELINQVVVYKTPDASLVGQGLSGTIDLRTVRPLSFPKQVVSVNVRGEKNSLGDLQEESKGYGSRVSAFYLDQFMDNKLGIALGYARLDSPGEAQRFEAWGYPNDNGGAPGSFLLGGAKVQTASTDNVRQGFMGVLEARPNEVYSTTLDLYYSKFDKAETTRFLETGLGWSGASLSNPVIEDGVVVSGTFTGIRPVLRNDLNEGNDKLFAIGWNNEFKFGDDWVAKLDASHSKADRNESILELYSGTRAGITDSVNFTLDPNGAPNFDFSRNYADPTAIVLTDPGGWGQEGYIKTPQIRDELNSFRADAEREFMSGIFSRVKFGVNHADREKSRRVPESFVDVITNETVVDPELLLDPPDYAFGLDGTLAYRVNPALARYYTLRVNGNNSDIVNKQWTVNEKLTSTYVQVDLQADLGPIPVRGNIGVQAQHANQDSDGFLVLQGDAAGALPFSGGDSYTDYLPSLNLAFTLPQEFTARLGLGRQLARPRIDQMRANNNTNLEFSGQFQGQWRRSGGNPELQPWIANALDVSLERYFGGRGYVSLAYFYKDLQSYVYDQTDPFDATGLPIPAGYTGPTPDAVGVYTRPANGSGGNVKGYEFTVSIPFDLFTPALEGFGLVGNYSDTSSSIKRLGPDGPDEPIAGLSKQVRNITLYYENHGFQARVSQRKRSDFLGEIQGFGADRALVYIDGESVVDAQVGYTFGEESRLNGTSVLFQVNNVTDEPYRQFFNGNGLTQFYAKYGRQYLLGVTYRF